MNQRLSVKEKLQRLLKQNSESWIIAWVGLFNNIIRILTLGFVIPDWEFRIIRWIIERKRERQKRDRKPGPLPVCRYPIGYQVKK